MPEKQIILNLDFVRHDMQVVAMKTRLEIIIRDHGSTGTIARTRQPGSHKSRIDPAGFMIFRLLE
ncbi:MAG: hypothetical protein H6560_19125 [Lewinellaceae bacterium]|nr:hypothetical protein [Lewinellaceae bacterium]